MGITKKKRDKRGYYAIPENIDGGLLSNWIFLPYDKWCENSIKYHTQKADENLTKLKYATIEMENIHRQTTLTNLYSFKQFKISENLFSTFKA